MAIKLYTREEADDAIAHVRILAFEDASDQRTVDLCLDERYTMTDADIRWFISLHERSTNGICPEYIHKEHPTTQFPEETD